jgi:hypothetical protein
MHGLYRLEQLLKRLSLDFTVKSSDAKQIDDLGEVDFVPWIKSPQRDPAEGKVSTSTDDFPGHHQKGQP